LDYFAARCGYRWHNASHGTKRSGKQHASQCGRIASNNFNRNAFH
jgi:hypothetical protein